MDFTNLDREQRSALMRSIKSKDTKPEMALRRALFARGFRYRLHVRDLPGKPDIVLPRWKTAIQVRGCFWHKHGCSRGKRKLSIAWAEKIERNQIRDEEKDALMRDLGWKILVVWECELESEKKIRGCVDSLEERIMCQ